jgi:hypothetical protein
MKLSTVKRYPQGTVKRYPLDGETVPPHTVKRYPLPIVLRVFIKIPPVVSDHFQLITPQFANLCTAS